MSIKVNLGAIKMDSKASAVRSLVRIAAKRGTPIHLAPIANRVGVKPATVSKMIRLLIKEGTVPVTCIPVRGRPTIKKTKVAKTSLITE